MREKKLKRIGLFNHSIQAGLFSSIFVFTSNIGGIRIILERSLAAILFPIAIAPDAIASLLALFSFGKAKNKNLGKTFDLFYVPAKAALVFTAVFAGLSLAMVHGLFVTAVGIGIIYHTSLTLYNAYQWWKTPKNSHLKLKNLYKNNVINNSISSLIGAIVLGGILATLVFAPALSPLILAIAGLGTATMLVLMTTYTVYRHFKQPTTSSPAATTSLDSMAETEKDVKQGYYYRECRDEKLTGNFRDKQGFILRNIRNKITRLEAEIERSERRGTAAAWREFFWPERSKRETKQEYLTLINTKIASLHGDAPADDVPLADLHKILSSPPSKVCQSFFRDVGDTEDIIEATKTFVNSYSR